MDPPKDSSPLATTRGAGATRRRRAARWSARRRDRRRHDTESGRWTSRAFRGIHGEGATKSARRCSVRSREERVTARKSVVREHFVTDRNFRCAPSNQSRNRAEKKPVGHGSSWRHIIGCSDGNPSSRRFHHRAFSSRRVPDGSRRIKRCWALRRGPRARRAHPAPSASAIDECRARSSPDSATSGRGSLARAGGARASAPSRARAARCARTEALRARWPTPGGGSDAPRGAARRLAPVSSHHRVGRDVVPRRRRRRGARRGSRRRRKGRRSTTAASTNTSPTTPTPMTRTTARCAERCPGCTRRPRTGDSFSSASTR